jgi:hypothetical protein
MLSKIDAQPYRIYIFVHRLIADTFDEAIINSAGYAGTSMVDHAEHLPVAPGPSTWLKACFVES